MKPGSLWLAIAFSVAAQGQWVVQNSGVPVSLRGVSAVSAQVCWASGAKGTWMRTVDGGKTWISGVVPGAEMLDFRDIEAWDGQRAVLMGAGPGALSRIYVTGDGGNTWKERLRNTDEAGFFDSMAWWDRQNGLVISDPIAGRFPIWVTRDGGESWKELDEPSLPRSLPGESGYAASGTMLVAGSKGQAWFGTSAGRIWRTADFGKTWAAVETPVRHDAAGAGVFSIAFAPDGHTGFAVGGNYQEAGSTAGTAAVTSDGGVTWRPMPGLSGYRSAVHLQGSQRVWAVGTNGTDLSVDGGRTWKQVSETGWNAISGAEGVVWAVGSGGRVGRWGKPVLEEPKLIAPRQR